MNKRITILLSFFLFAGHLPAYNTVPFWNEDFQEAFTVNGWTTQDETGADAVLWEYCTDFENCPPISLSGLGDFPEETFASNSPENGFAFIQPLFQGSFNDNHRSVLSTPAINCLSQQEVYLVFNTLIMANQSDPDTGAVIQVRVGTSGAWTEFPIFHFLNKKEVEADLLGNIISYNPHPVLIDISSVAAGADEVYIRWQWTWTGNEESFWLVDDVRLLNENPLDERAVWGTEPGQGDFRLGLNNWSVNAFSGCAWQWDEKGHVDVPDPGTKADFYGCSATVYDGVALVNSSSCQPLQQYTYSELVSPPIDLSLVAPGKKLALRFHQTGSLGNKHPDYPALPLSSVMVSSNNGQSYPFTIRLNTLQPEQKVFCETETVLLPDEVVGASSVRIKFVFSGEIIFWMLDDIRIIERWDHDLRLREDLYSVAPNYATPAALVSPFRLAADVQNFGNEMEESASLYVEITRNDTQNTVFRDTLMLDPLESGQSTDELAFKKLFFPPAEKASYTCTYQVVAGQDQDTTNNRIEWNFEITNGLFSKNKEPRSVYAGFTPSESVRYETGNCFFIPPGEELRATKISFAMANASQVLGTNLSLNLYEWKKGDNWGDVNQDSLANPDEYEWITGNSFLVNSSAYRLRDVITANLYFDEPAVLKDSTYYFVTVGYDDPVPNPLTGSFNRFFISVTEDINYTTMYLQSYKTPYPRFVSMLRLGNENYFRANSWGLQRIPYIQLHVENLTNVREIVSNSIEIEAYPNPSVDIIYLNADFEGLQNEVSVEIFDIWGRLVLSRQFENIFVRQLPIELSGFCNGSYILRLSSNEKSGTSRFFILKN